MRGDLVTAFALALLAAASPADAGIFIRPIGPPVAARTPNPTHILLVGSLPPRIERDLRAAGHQVDVVAKFEPLTRKQYLIVIVESRAELVEALDRDRFNGEAVLVAGSDVVDLLRRVEQTSARWSLPLRCRSESLGGCVQRERCYPTPR